MLCGSINFSAQTTHLQSLPLAAIMMNIPDALGRSFDEFEDMMQQPQVFRNPNRATIGKGKGKAECPGKESLGKGKGRARDKNQIVRTYYAPMADTRQTRGCAMTNKTKTLRVNLNGMAWLC